MGTLACSITGNSLYALTDVSFRSLTTTITSSESGRRKSARCWRTVVSTPSVTRLLLASSCTLAHGAGSTRKRYHASFCDGNAHPEAPTPLTMLASVAERPPRSAVPGGVSCCVGSQARKPSPFQVAACPVPQGSVRVTSRPRSPPTGSPLGQPLGAFVHVPEPKSPRSELTTPTCRSRMGAISRSEPAGHGSRGPAGCYRRRAARGVDAAWVDEPAEEIREAYREDLRRVAHRQLVVEGEEHVDLGDARRIDARDRRPARATPGPALGAHRALAAGGRHDEGQQQQRSGSHAAR